MSARTLSKQKAPRDYRKNRNRPTDLNAEIRDLLSRPTADVRRVAFAFYGIKSDDAAYRAARNGDILCEVVNGRYYALTKPLRRLVPK